MALSKICGILENPLKADKSAVGAINRPLQMAGELWEWALSRPNAVIEQPMVLLGAFLVNVYHYMLL